MKFKEWQQLDEVRWKGLYRQYQQMHPDKPKYVIDQMYRSMIHPGVQRATDNLQNIKSQSDATRFAKRPVTQDPDATHFAKSEPFSQNNPNLIQDTIKNKETLNGVRFSKKPRKITISPANLESQTILRLMYVKFGLAPKDSEVRNDSLRHEIHRKLSIQNGEGENEPIILIRQMDGKYELIDGYHRISAYFLQSAPPQDVENIKSGNFRKINFNQWRPVTLNAYVGFQSEPIQMQEPKYKQIGVNEPTTFNRFKKAQ